MLTRPEHLRKRAMQGRAFSKDATLKKVTGSRNTEGEWVSTETSTSIKCATTPPPASRARELSEAGITLSAARLFWTVEDLVPTADDSEGDVIEYLGERWRVKMVQPWGTFSEAVAVRIEGQ